MLHRAGWRQKQPVLAPPWPKLPGRTRRNRPSYSKLFRQLHSTRLKLALCVNWWSSSDRRRNLLVKSVVVKHQRSSEQASAESRVMRRYKKE